MFLLALVGQIVALFILIIVVGLGCFLWLRPHWGRTGFQGYGLLFIIILTFAGGLLGGFAWWFDIPNSFSWDLPPLASRMLASAGWSFAVVCFLCLQHPAPRRVRLVLLLTAVYLLPLVVAALLFHLDRFDFTVPITYSFFFIAGGITVAVLWYLLRQPSVITDLARDSVPSSLLVRLWLLALSLLLTVWGLALFITDAGFSNLAGLASLIWVWPGDLLTSRLIGVMLLAIAAGALYSLPRADTARLMLWTTATYGLGLALASAWSIIGNAPIKISYLLVFGWFFVISAVLLLLPTKLPARQPAPVPNS